MTAQRLSFSHLSSFGFRVMSRDSHPLPTRLTGPLASSLRKPNYLILPSRVKVGYARLPPYLLSPSSQIYFPIYASTLFVLSFVSIFKVHVQAVREKA